MQNTGPKEKTTYFGYFLPNNLNITSIKNAENPSIAAAIFVFGNSKIIS